MKTRFMVDPGWPPLTADDRGCKTKYSGTRMRRRSRSAGHATAREGRVSYIPPAAPRSPRRRRRRVTRPVPSPA